MQASLNIGLKEWAAVCQALERGRQMILLRKGGIYESSGEFEVEHRQFVLFPTYLHQNAAMLKEREHEGLVACNAEPVTIEIKSAAEVTDIVQLKSRGQMDAIFEEHVWTEALIDMRFKYRPENPLYLMLVRAYRLAEAVKLENTPAFAGCKSWVPLGREISMAEAVSALDDYAYERRRKRIVELTS